MGFRPLCGLGAAVNVQVYVRSFGGDWEIFPSRTLHDHTYEAKILQGGEFFPAKAITIEYEDGTEMRYVKEAS